MSGLNVWVVCGGPSGEAEVSRTSARAVVKALEAAGHRTTLVEFEPKMTQALLASRPDVVFPLTHGTLGEDGCLQGLLEVFDVPYVGCGVLASALGTSKPMAKAVWRLAGLPVAREFVVRRGSQVKPDATTIRQELPGKPLAVKPANGGSAIGVKRVSGDGGDAELCVALESVLEMDVEVIVEPWMDGVEVTCGVLEDDGGPKALPPTLILPARADFYDFASKYAKGGSRHVCPAPLPADFVERIRELAVATHRTLGARDLSRTDFIVDQHRGVESGITILEINTLPGMTSTSLFPEAAAAAGLGFEALVDGLVRRAFARPRRQKPEVFAMPT
ncbi:MAG: D-alanine--D-alanine ligase [Polyangiaceae bacterium]